MKLMRQDAAMAQVRSRRSRRRRWPGDRRKGDPQERPMIIKRAGAGPETIGGAET